MDEQFKLSFVRKLSLEEMALRRVVVNLWMESDILAEIAKSSIQCCGYLNSYNPLIDVNKVNDKVSKLLLPDSLKKRMMPIVKPVGFQFLIWKAYHEKVFGNGDFFNMNVLEHLRWTSDGSIDFEKTAKELVRVRMLGLKECEMSEAKKSVEMFDVEERDVMLVNEESYEMSDDEKSNMLGVEECYTLACTYCLVDYIPTLWRKMREWNKKSLNYDKDPLADGEMHLKYFWTNIMYKTKYSMISRSLTKGSFNKRAFNWAAHCFNITATKYFFQKVSNEEIESSLWLTVRSLVDRDHNDCVTHEFPEGKHADVICYLLPKMSLEQLKRHIFEKVAFDVLLCFLRWPWQDVLLDIIDYLWNFLLENDKKFLLFHITLDTKKEGSFPCIFQAFFPHSPSELRKHFVDVECSNRYESWNGRSFFVQFFEAEDTQSIKIVFRNLEHDDRMRLVTSDKIFKLLEHRVMRDDWHLVELCIREAAYTRDDRERVKDAFLGFVTYNASGEMELRTQKWIRFFQHLDGIDAGALSMEISKCDTLSNA